MSTLGASDRLESRTQRILVVGTSGSGKTTLARAVSAALGVPHTELDALHHGPEWTVRPTFLNDVQRLADSSAWVTEYQYDQARPLLLARSDLVVFLDFSRLLVMRRVIVRTVRRAWRREVLWNGNVEPPLRTILTDPEHVVRWAWRAHGLGADRIAQIRRTRPDLPVVVLRAPREAERWLRSLSDQQVADRVE